MNEFVVYVLYSHSTNKTYVGYTSDLINRMQSHNIFDKKGYTKNFRPWMVLHVEFYESKSVAMKRELELKTGKGREFIRKQLLG